LRWRLGCLISTITLHRTLDPDTAESLAAFLRTECGIQPIDNTPDPYSIPIPHAA
jgi:hypothetical protein